jgi:NAD(P)-dependent dehydrogenase (short-subunit alcohol dehydrogenase family)
MTRARTGGRRFDGRVALVTGGGDAGDVVDVGLGIGAMICEKLAGEGAAVAVVDRDIALATCTAQRITDTGGVARPVRADVSNETDCRSAVAEIVDEFGRLDVLIHNVGIESYRRRTSPDGKPIDLAHAPTVAEVEESDWAKVMAVNVTGMLLMTKHASRHLGAGSAIVTISSLAALTPLRGTAAYSTSKGAVLSLTSAMAVDLAPVRANCVLPGSVWTPIARRKLPVDPELVQSIRDERRGQTLVGIEGSALDIANATAFLASDDARWITGQYLLVDGGRALGYSNRALPGEASRRGGDSPP